MILKKSINLIRSAEIHSKSKSNVTIEDLHGTRWNGVNDGCLDMTSRISKSVIKQLAKYNLEVGEAFLFVSTHGIGLHEDVNYVEFTLGTLKLEGGTVVQPLCFQNQNQTFGYENSVVLMVSDGKHSQTQDVCNVDKLFWFDPKNYHALINPGKLFVANIIFCKVIHHDKPIDFPIRRY